MAGLTTSGAVWELVERQHGVIAHRQLRALGFSEKAIEHRVRKGRLRPLWRGVYAVGRPGVTREGHWMAAVLACGEGALLSHLSAAALWRIKRGALWPIHVSVPRSRDAKHNRIVVHRRSRLDRDAQTKAGILVTSPVLTLIDLATTLSDNALVAAVNETDKLDLVHLADLRTALDGRREPGSGRLRRLIDRATFVLTDTELERLFVPIARRAGLGKPLTQVYVNGHRVDFYWPDIPLVVETDGGRFHRTALQQTQDRIRDQAHAATRTPMLRFTHAQIRYEPGYVADTLARTATARGRAAARGRGAQRRRRSRPGRGESA
jgi:very-short-patch-repair endonuclease